MAIAVRTAPRIRPTRRRIGVALVLLLVAVGVPFGCWLYFLWADDRSLADAVAETERLDPHWRFAEILAARPGVPDEENASLQVIQVMKLNGKSYLTIADDEYELVTRMPPPFLFDGAHVKFLRAELGSRTEAVAAARKLRDMPLGRAPIRYSPDFISTLCEPIQQARSVTTLLQLDVLLKAHEGDIDGAIDSCRAMLNAARSVGDEPFLISVLVRTACVHLTIDALERVLAQGEPSEAQLAAMQAALEQELTEPILLAALRGERAGLHNVLQLVSDGKVPASFLLDVSGQSLTPLGRVLHDWFPARAILDRAAFLRMMNEMVEAAKLPIEQQAAEFDRINDRWAEKVPNPPGATRWMEKTAATHLRAHANMRCAIASLAAERYRIAKGKWPESLDAVVKAGLLRSIPLDPFDGQPLRLKRVDDRLLVYSIGADRMDNGGAIDRNAPPPLSGTDLGFRLWDPTSRGRPAQ